MQSFWKRNKTKSGWQLPQTLEYSCRFYAMILQLDRLRDIVANLSRDVAALSNYSNDSMYHIASFDGYWNIKENRPFADIQFSGVLHNLSLSLSLFCMGKLQTKLSRSFTPDIIRFSNARAWRGTAWKIPRCFA